MSTIGSFFNIVSPAVDGVVHIPYSSSIAPCTGDDCKPLAVLSYVTSLDGKYVAAITPIVPLTIIPNINPTK